MRTTSLAISNNNQIRNNSGIMPERLGQSPAQVLATAINDGQGTIGDASVTSYVNAIPVMADQTFECVPETEAIPVSPLLAPCTLAGNDSPSSQGGMNSWSRAEFVSATVAQKDTGSQLGITMGKNDSTGDITVKKLCADGVLVSSPLRVGDTILSINGRSCRGKKLNELAALLHSFKGAVTIVAHNQGGNPSLVEAMVEKPKPSSCVGIGVHESSHGTLHISKVSPEGLFSDSVLNPGDRFLSINGRASQQLGKQMAVDMIRNAPRFVTITTETLPTRGVVVAEFSERSTTVRAGLVSATVTKRSAGARLGVGVIREFPSGYIRINKLRSCGILNHSPLKIGDRILTINGRSCRRMDTSAVGVLLRRLTGTVTIVAQNQGGDPSLIEAMVEKPEPGSTLGIRLTRTWGSLAVASIRPDGLLRHSGLAPRDRILSINSCDCQWVNQKMAAAMIRSSSRYTTIVAWRD